MECLGQADGESLSQHPVGEPHALPCSGTPACSVIVWEQSVGNTAVVHMGPDPEGQHAPSDSHAPMPRDLSCSSLWPLQSLTEARIENIICYSLGSHIFNSRAVLSTWRNSG